MLGASDGIEQILLNVTQNFGILEDTIHTFDCNAQRLSQRRAIKLLMILNYFLVLII